ncbi:presqualene diphosphate synthase HpnD [Chelatococcus sambhunathii]|uniref:Presqualene diphosphate synthase HpnD n=1 Tax=Chelatococcus sambhunathii TaxID=363953 RepID=A0ABU1DL48_9HYPH|nr:presqualene diphosphate synthase HpnD [Chelatococcus sambhunathii]MDR4308829.1 presqualene diphosphate synthase HpnD [Chelatococcus sambhunathii]
MSGAPSLEELKAKVAGSSFYVALRALPPQEREAMFAVYAFCRAVDDIADDQQGARPERAAALASWREDIDALYAGGDPGQAAFLADPVARFGLVREDFHAVIDGMAMDVERDMRWPDAATLDLYCDRVASAVGRLSVRVFGMEEETGIALSRHLGRALQLTNILRDIDEDAAIGRVYLPEEHLVGAGVALISPAEVAADPRVDAAARALAKEAHAHYRAAEAILAARPRGLLIAPRMMAAVYGRILERLEATGWRPPRTRVRVNKAALVWTFMKLRLTS